MILTSDFNFPFFTSTPFSIYVLLLIWIWWMGQSNFSDCFSSSFLKMEDLQLTTLHILVFIFSKTRKSMNMPISASKKEHLFSRIKGCLFIINVGHTRTVFSSFLDEIGWFKNNRQFYLQYIVLYVCIYMVIWLYSRFLVLPSAVSYQYIYYIIYNMFNIYIYKLYIYIYYVYILYYIYIYIYIYIKQFTI